MVERKLWAAGVDPEKLSGDERLRVVREAGISIGHLLWQEDVDGGELAFWCLLEAIRSDASVDHEVCFNSFGDAHKDVCGNRKAVKHLLKALKHTKKALESTDRDRKMHDPFGPFNIETGKT